MSLNLQADAANTQEDVSAELKADSIADIDNAEEVKAIIKEGVQAVLENLEEY